MFDSLKFKMSAIFILNKEPPKKHKCFVFSNGCYFVMSDPLDMNLGVIWETSVGFLKSVVLQLFWNIAEVMSIWIS